MFTDKSSERRTKKKAVFLNETKNKTKKVVVKIKG